MQTRNASRTHTLTRCALLVAWLYTPQAFSIDENSASFTIPQAPVNPNLIRLEGKITDAMAALFEKRLEAHPPQPKEGPFVVELNSLGGNSLAAIRIGRLIHAHEGHTRVSGKCASACVYIFLAGKTRIAGDRQLGLHRPRVTRKIPGTTIEIEIYPEVSSNARAFEEDARSQLVAYLYKLQLQNKTIRNILSIEHQDLYWMNKADAVREGISTTE
jgi:hypothetical protein